MSDSYSLSQASDILHQNEFGNINSAQFNQKLRVELLEMQLKESQEREKNQSKLNEQLFKAFQESEQRLKDLRESQNQRREIQIISDQHERSLQQTKDYYESTIRKQKSEMDNLKEENEVLKVKNMVLEEQKLGICGDTESRQQGLKQENVNMHKEIQFLREEISQFQQKAEQSRLKFEEEQRLQSQKKVGEEREKWENQMRQLQADHSSEIRKLQEQNHQNEQLWNKKIENANSQRIVVEQYKANDQMLFQLHRQNDIQEIQSLKQINSDQNKEIEQLKGIIQQLQRGSLSQTDLLKEMEEIKKQKKKYDEQEKSYKDLESRFIEVSAEYEQLKKSLQEIEFDAKYLKMNQQLEKEELHRRISNERKKSLDLNNKLHETQVDYSKKKSTIVKEILKQDNQIKELSKRLSLSQIMTLSQQQQLLSSQIQQQQIIQNNSHLNIQPLQIAPQSPSMDICLSNSINSIANAFNFNASQQTILSSSQKNIQMKNPSHQQPSLQNQQNQQQLGTNQPSQKLQTQNKKQDEKNQTRNNQNNNKITPSLNDQNTKRHSSGQNRSIKQLSSKSPINRADQNISSLQLNSPTSINRLSKITFERQQIQQTSSKETRKSSLAPPSSTVLQQQKSPQVSIKKQGSRETLNSSYYVPNTAMRKNEKLNSSYLSKKGISSNNPSNNNSNNISMNLNGTTMLSPSNRQENSQKYLVNSANQNSGNSGKSNNLNRNYSIGAISQFNKSTNKENALPNAQNNQQNNYVVSNQNQSFSVSEYIKAHSNQPQSEQQIQDNQNNQSTYSKLQQQNCERNSFNLNDNSLGKLSILTANQQQQEKSNEDKDFLSQRDSQLEYNYNSSNSSYPVIHMHSNINESQQESHQRWSQIQQNNKGNSISNNYNPSQGYIIQDIQSEGTEETTQTLNTLQNSQTLSKIDMLQLQFQLQSGNQEAFQQQQIKNQIENKLYPQLQNQLQVGDNNTSLQERAQKESNIPQTRIELCHDHSQYFSQDRKEDLQLETIVSQCRILNEFECLRTSSDEIKSSCEVPKKQEISDGLSKLHQMNQQSKQQQVLTKPPQKHYSENINYQSRNFNKYQSNENKENQNSSNLNNKSSSSAYQKYNYMPCFNDYSLYSKNRNKNSDLIAPSAGCSSIIQDSDESLNLFSKQFLSSNQMNPSFCSENERFSILHNRKFSDINFNFNGELNNYDKQQPQKIIVIDQLDENNQSESNLSQSYLERPSAHNTKTSHVVTSKNQTNNKLIDHSQFYQGNQVLETEEINQDINEFEDGISKNEILSNVIDKKHLSKFMQNY